MADTTTTNFGITLPENTGSDDTWGLKTNANWQLVDQLLGSILTKNVSGNSNVSLSDADCLYGFIVLTGTLTGNIEVQPVAKARRYIVYNNTTGAFSLTFKPSGATGPVLPQGKYSLVYCDGTNCAMAFESYSVSSFIETLLDDADAATARSTLGLGTLATKSTVATGDIADEAVTLAKLQHIASARLLGRSTAGDGDPEQITIGSGLQLSGGALACTVQSKVAQVKYDTYANQTSVSAQIPYDNTTPQITEGTQILSVSITPTNAASTLEIEALVYGMPDGSDKPFVIALFVDSTADAIQAAAVDTYSLEEGTQSVPLKAFVTAGSTSARTYRIRVGPSSAQNLYLNRVPSGAKLNGKVVSYLKVTEYLP